MAQATSQRPQACPLCRTTIDAASVTDAAGGRALVSILPESVTMNELEMTQAAGRTRESWFRSYARPLCRCVLRRNVNRRGVFLAGIILVEAFWYMWGVDVLWNGSALSGARDANGELENVCASTWQNEQSSYCMLTQCRKENDEGQMLQLRMQSNLVCGFLSKAIFLACWSRRSRDSGAPESGGWNVNHLLVAALFSWFIIWCIVVDVGWSIV
jgi:hypothetical protein